MKKLLLMILAAATLTACRSHLFAELPEGATASPIIPLRIAGELTTHYLTDYLPTWEGADSLTVCPASGLEIAPVKEDWSEFSLTSNGAVTIATIEAWKEGKALSFVALGGSRNQAAQLFSSGSMMEFPLRSKRA